jgi:hypothetical protein
MGMTMGGVRRLAVGGVCGLLLTGFAAACGEREDNDAAKGAPSDSATPAASSGAGTDALDVRRSGDLSFYQLFNQDGADWVRHYDDLDEGTRASTAVVVARVVDVVVTRFFQGEAADDRFPMIGLVLRPTDVAAGALPPEFGDRLTVEFVGATGSDEEDVAKLKRRLPAQPGLWFLHLKSQGLPEERGFFRPISPQGLFVQGNQGVETPLTTDGDGDMAAEGRTFRRLSALVQRVRGVR